MGMKMTINKMKSEDSAIEEAKKNEEEIDSLRGVEKIKFEIKVLESRIFNIREDIKKWGSNIVFQQKLNLMNNQIKKLKEQLKDEENSV